MVFFLLAYLMSVVLASLSITMVTYAIIGALIAAIFVLGKGQGAKTSSASAGSAALEDNDDDDF